MFSPWSYVLIKLWVFVEASIMWSSEEKLDAVLNSAKEGDKKK